jgi:hypothetical protein
VRRWNHFPHGSELTRKDRLGRNMARAQALHGRAHYEFAPSTYTLPQECDALLEECAGDPYAWWIVKPSASSRGRGIYVATSAGELPVNDGDPCVVSRYIPNPLLVDGFKFDLRVYVLVTGVCPLRIYVHEEGLCRFATERYSTSSASSRNLFMHLTNYSINKRNEHFVSNQSAEQDDYGNKWSLAALRRYFERSGIPWDRVFREVDDIIVKSLIAVESKLAAGHPFQRGGCFELFGFDILIDDRLSPWLLEVNLSPSLACDSPLDYKLKSEVLADALNVTGIRAGGHDPHSATAAGYNGGGGGGGGSGSGAGLRGRSSGVHGGGWSRRAGAPSGGSSSSSAAAGGGHHPPSASSSSSSTGSSGGSDDACTVREIADEFERAETTGFRRVYPAADAQRYDPLFDVPRRANALVRERVVARMLAKQQRKRQQQQQQQQQQQEHAAGAVAFDDSAAAAAGGDSIRDGATSADRDRFGGGSHGAEPTGSRMWPVLPRAGWGGGAHPGSSRSLHSGIIGVSASRLPQVGGAAGAGHLAATYHSGMRPVSRQTTASSSNDARGQWSTSTAPMLSRNGHGDDDTLGSSQRRALPPRPRTTHGGGYQRRRGTVESDDGHEHRGVGDDDDDNLFVIDDDDDDDDDDDGKNDDDNNDNNGGAHDGDGDDHVEGDSYGNDDTHGEYAGGEEGGSGFGKSSSRRHRHLSAASSRGVVGHSADEPTRPQIGRRRVLSARGPAGGNTGDAAKGARGAAVARRKRDLASASRQRAGVPVGIAASPVGGAHLSGMPVCTEPMPVFRPPSAPALHTPTTSTTAAQSQPQSHVGGDKQIATGKSAARSPSTRSGAPYVEWRRR